MKIYQCIKLDKSFFHLTVFLNTQVDYTSFLKTLSLLKEHISEKKIMVILFCGEPMVESFGNHFLPKDIDTLFLHLYNIFKDKLNIDIYSDLLIQEDEFLKTIEYLLPFNNKFSWRFTPEYYSPSSLKFTKLFKKNFELVYSKGCLGETSFIITENNYEMDKILYEDLVKLFPKAKINMIPKQGEESLNIIKSSFLENEVTHNIIYVKDNFNSQDISYSEILYREFNKFKGMYCDTQNHIVIDMLGRVYPCMTAFSNKNTFISELSKDYFNLKDKTFVCPYDVCKYDDSMSVTLCKS